MKKNPLIVRAIRLCGSQKKLANAMACAQQTVSKLLYYQIPVSAEQALALHNCTAGRVPASKLRPDLWPTLAHVPCADGSKASAPA